MLKSRMKISRKNTIIHFISLVIIILGLAGLLFVAGCRPHIDSYICQVDDCRTEIVDLIGSVDDSIYFMIYSLTDDEIGNALIDAHKRGIEIKGVMEKQQRSKYSEFDNLKDAGVNVKWDRNSALMHHKVLILDKKVVVTGSCNPTNNGFERNDENIVVIRDSEIVKDFLTEFWRVWG